MRIVFMGSPDFALPSLQRLIDSEHDVLAVFTQPDKPSGRGRRLTPPPVKTLALHHGIPVHQPTSISKRDGVETLRRLAPDVAIIAAYGQILRQPVLDVPRLGVLNVHASLLPRWRGAAPIPAAILAGDERTGATIMKVVLALDAGPMLASAAVPIAPEDTTATLTPKVAEAGAALLIDVLPKYSAGAITPIEQQESLVTYAPQLDKDAGLIDWNGQSAEQIARMVRAYNPWPMAYTRLAGQPLRLIEAAALPYGATGPAGTIVQVDGSFGVVTADGVLGIGTVQPPGGRPMAGAAYLNGHRDIIGKWLG